MKYKGLTYQQHRFVDLFLKGKRQGLAYAEAYGIDDEMDEGYSTAATSASKLLKNPKIMEHIDKVLTRRYKKVNLTAERVLSEIMNIAFVDIRQFYDEDGNFKSIHELTIAQQAAIEKIEVEQLFDGRGEEREYIGDLKKLVFHNKGKALEMLCKNLKLLGDNQETGKGVEVKVNVYPQTTHVFQDIKHGDEQHTEQDADRNLIHAPESTGSNRIKI